MGEWLSGSMSGQTEQEAQESLSTARRDVEAVYLRSSRLRQGVIGCSAQSVSACRRGGGRARRRSEVCGGRIAAGRGIVPDGVEHGGVCDDW